MRWLKGNTVIKIMLPEMPETNNIGRLTPPALALGAWLDAVAGYPASFSTTSWPCITSPWLHLGADWWRREDDMNVSVGDAHSWNVLGAVILRGNLGSCSLSWTTKSSLWGGRKRGGEKGSRWWEDVCTREGKQHSRYLFHALWFCSL